MRKVIPYIASQFRKDKIWLRRTKKSKRDYQIVLAVDDSSSMADNHSKQVSRCFPVRTRRRFDVKITSCAYWVLITLALHFLSINTWNGKINGNGEIYSQFLLCSNGGLFVTFSIEY